MKAYIVLVIDGYPRSARIEYADGGIFNMEYGTGDISGIYGGIFEKEEKINDIRVSFYRYTDDKSVIISYGIWEKNGFTYSLSRAENLAQEIQNLTK